MFGKHLIQLYVHPVKRKKKHFFCFFPKVDRYRYLSQTMFLSCFSNVKVSTRFLGKKQHLGKTIKIESGSQVQMTVTSLLPWVLVARRKRKKGKFLENGKSNIDVQTGYQTLKVFVCLFVWWKTWMAQLSNEGPKSAES